MKKLMCAAAALVAGIAMADGITSDNVVGYSGQELLTDGDQKFVTAQFLNTGDTTSPIDLQTFKIVEAEDAADGTVYLSSLGGGGETVGLYRWKYFSATKKYGWADVNAGKIYAEGVTFAPGTALWLQNDEEDAFSIQTAGQVAKNDVTVELLTEGDQVSGGNPFPVSVDLQDFTIDEYEEAADGTVYLSILGGGGETSGLYRWKYFSATKKYGWADVNAGKIYAEGVTINPGEGVWIQNDEEDAYNLTINAPSALKSL